MKTVKQSVKLIWATPNPLNVIERIGRVCYKSEDKITPDSAEKFVKMLIDRGHEAMIEHVSASFLIITDRGISHEIVRHRIASYAQESTRYCNYNKEKFDKEITIIEPDLSMAECENPYPEVVALSCWNLAMDEAERCYDNLILKNIPPQIARSVLPTCLKTEIIMTTNAREWRHFLKLRLSRSAHPQIREISRLIYEELVQWGGVLFSDINPKTGEKNVSKAGGRGIKKDRKSNKIENKFNEEILKFEAEVIYLREICSTALEMLNCISCSATSDSKSCVSCKKFKQTLTMIKYGESTEDGDKRKKEIMELIRSKHE